MTPPDPVDARREFEHAGSTYRMADLTAQVGTPAAVTSVEHGDTLHYVLRTLLTE
jgi:hypothetical protein